jgi:hypothetical protein
VQPLSTSHFYRWLPKNVLRATQEYQRTKDAVLTSMVASALEALSSQRRRNDPEQQLKVRNHGVQ